MWTEQSRGRMAEIIRKTKRYPSDLTDEEWARIEPLMPKPGRRGRPREADLREIINALRYCRAASNSATALLGIRPILPYTLFATQQLTVQRNREFWRLICNKVMRKVEPDNQHEQPCY